MTNEKKPVAEEEFSLEFYSRSTDSILLELSTDLVGVLTKKANERDLPLGALLKRYIAQGLREDLSEEEAKELALKRLHSRNRSPNSDRDLAA